MNERKSSDQRTADLLAAAERLLKRRQRITVSELASEAGIASGTFYLYFPSKAHLEATLIERFIDSYVEAAARAIRQPGSLHDRLDATFDAMISMSLAHKQVLRLQAAHAPTAATREIIGRRTDQMKALIADAIRDAVALGESSVDDPEMSAALLFHGTAGVIRETITNDRELDGDRLRRALHQHLSTLTGAAA